jgi:hypothetical protein
VPVIRQSEPGGVLGGVIEVENRVVPRRIPGETA